MERWQLKGRNRVYIKHLSLSTMEKVKAHDRYKHICYWVVQLLYFDGLDSDISTQVGLFDLVCVCVCVHVYFVNVHKGSTSTKPKPPVFLFFFKMCVNTTPDPLVVALRSAVRNRQSCGSNDSTHVWGHTHTKGMLGIIVFSFLTCENKIYTISCLFCSSLIFTTTYIFINTV